MFPAPAPHFYEFGVFRLDADERVLYARDEPVRLTPKAMHTLILLVERNGHIVEKNEILETVWENTFVEEGVLSFNIASLRKTLAKFDSEQTFIQTVPKRGFRFVAPVREIADAADDIIIERRAVVETLITEITPEVEPETRPEKLLAGRAPLKISIFGKVFAAAALLVGAVAAFFYFQSPRAKPPEKMRLAGVKSIAVAPLKSFSATPAADAEFRLRITDALITNLANLRSVAVRPTSAVLPFADGATNAADIGKSLAVDAVLDGSVQRDGDKLRLTLQLVSTADGSQLWARQFDETFNDVFALQDAAAARVFKTLAVDLQSPPPAAARRPTDNAEAYEAFLRGRFYWNQRTEKGFARSLEFFEQAIALDPAFAEAYVGLADAHLGFYDYALRPTAATVPVARAALENALRLKPDSADALASLAFIQFVHDHDADAGLKSAARAVELDPHNALARHRYGWFLMIAGDNEAGLAQMTRALELDPLSPTIGTNIGYAHFCARRYDRASEQFRKVINANPNISLPLWYLGATFHEQGRSAEMFEAYFKALELDGDAGLARRLAEIYRERGANAVFRAWRDELKTRAAGGSPNYYNLALTSALLKDREQTLFWLEQAKRERDPWLVQVKYDPEFDFVADDPKYQEFVPFVGKN